MVSVCVIVLGGNHDIFHFPGECVWLLVKAGADVFARNSENKTAKDLADMATESDTVQFLASCETGLIPDTAPKKKVGCYCHLLET